MTAPNESLPPSGHRPDADLLAAAREGDRTALEALIVRYQPRVYRFAVKMCRDLEDAGDIMQDTLLAMLRSIREFRGDATVSTWLYTIARSFCIKKRRRRKFAPVHQESVESRGDLRRSDPPDPAPGPEEQAAGREIERALSAAIDSLDTVQREVLVLRDIEGLSAPEVAKVLGVSVQAVKSRLHRARLAVRQRVAPVLGLPATTGQAGTRCPDVLALFSRYLEGEIAPEVCAEMEVHLEGCAPCRDACTSLRQTLALCRGTQPPDVPPLLEESVRNAIRAFLQQTA
ncbi:MAG: sigma-70 family RNA polymerase sigma factor [Acidobacteria bacterium]|nr:sigma-70 family RNA polymerase sigma factor [Acidobacteriota bacterium]